MDTLADVVVAAIEAGTSVDIWLAINPIYYSEIVKRLNRETRQQLVNEIFIETSYGIY